MESKGSLWVSGRRAGVAAGERQTFVYNEVVEAVATGTGRIATVSDIR